MVSTFRKHIQKSLHDQNLQVALDANAERRIVARTQAINSLSEPWELLRQQAHDVRSKTIAQLDDYLDQFIEQAIGNGLIVHRAENADQAVRFVLDIAREKGAKLIAKSKTMVSEEIELNSALEAHGYRVVETDLGEYIIQLRGEPPCHIITPAVHLRKEDVGLTFHEKLDIPYTEDIPSMTAVARKQLRETFLNADIGISGVNFGVVESGTICLVTNEGNGRMVTTLPPVHIALMGIERLVPTFADLVLMLKLLPRSATGQKITVYTTLINAPRQPGEIDGALERHLILVDNGRQVMRDSPLVDGLLCIRCGACLNACPVFAEIGGHGYVDDQGKNTTYPGPIGSIVSPGLFGQDEFGHLARASSLCGACRDACPVDIDLPKLLLRVRAGGVTVDSKEVIRKVPSALNIGLRFYTWFAVNPRRFSSALKSLGFFSNLISPRSDWLRVPGITGWGYSKDLPKPAEIPFRDLWKKELETESDPLGGQASNEGRERTAADIPQEAPQVEEDLVEKFAAELIALDGQFTFCNKDDLADLIFAELQVHGISSMLSWARDLLPDRLIETLEAKGIRIQHEFDQSVKAGITGAAAAIADTGTILTLSGQGQPQFVSLTPEIHFAVLKVSSIYKDLGQVMHLPWIRHASNCVLISGPSRTADIEMTLTLGVHGPREVHVFCLRE